MVVLKMKDTIYSEKLFINDHINFKKTTQMKAKKIYLSLVLLFVLVLSSSCIFDFNVITGKGNIITESRSAKDFSTIELQTSADVEIVKGSTFNVSVSDYENLVKYLNVEVVDNRLIIKKQSKVINLWNSKAKVIVTLPDPLYSIKLAGSGNMKVLSTFNDLQFLLLSGSGNIEVNCNCRLNKLDAQIAGSGNIDGNGSVQELYTKISGSGNIQFSEMKAKNANCTLSGSGNIYVFIENKLDAYLSGSGDIVYSGSPVVNSHLSGSGSIYKR